MNLMNCKDVKGSGRGPI